MNTAFLLKANIFRHLSTHGLQCYTRCWLLVLADASSSQLAIGINFQDDKVSPNTPASTCESPPPSSPDRILLSLEVRHPRLSPAQYAQAANLRTNSV